MTTETGRLLHQDEQAIVTTLLNLHRPAADWLLPQIPDLRVVGGCSCGCPTVDFRDDADGLELIADARVAGTDGDAIFLFGHDGVIDRLEYMWIGGPPPAAWPTPEALMDPRSSRRIS
ncbi:hypothetical protein ACQP2F_39645 [Actinoplanes sp. CA-030573]|uniref:hypothetical protein n=1 Tax=Actinoplanes sp. CA-030573 TaxID=3239898 RepID=UPI003D8D54C9